MARPRWIMAPHVDSAAMYSAAIHFKSVNDKLWNDLELEGQLSYIIHEPGEPANLHVNLVKQMQCPGGMRCRRCRTHEGGYIFRWLSPLWAKKYKELARSGAWLPGEPEWTIPNECTGRIVRSNGAIVETQYLACIDVQCCTACENEGE